LFAIPVGGYAGLMASSLFLSIGVLASFALVGGGLYTWRKEQDAKRGMLMIVAALLVLGNVLILAWP
jgi:hypothetical protein